MRREDNWQALAEKLPAPRAERWSGALSADDTRRLRSAAARLGLSEQDMLSRCITAGTGLPKTAAERMRASRARKAAKAAGGGKA